MFPTKWVFMAAISIFELGSLICAVSKSMDILIFGRAFSGVGAAGIFGSVIAIIAEIAPIERRPVRSPRQCQGLLSAEGLFLTVMTNFLPHRLCSAGVWLSLHVSSLMGHILTQLPHRSFGAVFALSSVGRIPSALS